MFGTGFLPHRATTFGLPGLVAVVLLVVTCLGRRPAGVLLAGVLAALLAPFHFYAFPAAYLIVGLYVVTSGAWRARTVLARRACCSWPRSCWRCRTCCPPCSGRATRARSDSSWAGARRASRDGPAAVAFFYVTNLGHPGAARRSRRWSCCAARDGCRIAGFLAAWLVALFLVPNVVRMSAVDFDMNKYFQIMWIAAAILAAWLVARWPRPAIAAVLAVCAISPALIAHPSRDRTRPSC